MKTTEREENTVGYFIGELLDATNTLAQRATESAAGLAAQAATDTRRVVRSFEALVEASVREGLEMVRRTMEVVREATEHAEEETDRRTRQTSSVDVVG